jgi:hypothetical protein
LGGTSQGIEAGSHASFEFRQATAAGSQSGKVGAEVEEVVGARFRLRSDADGSDHMPVRLDGPVEDDAVVFDSDGDGRGKSGDTHSLTPFS